MEASTNTTPDTPMALSHTRVKQFESCPMAYRLRYVERDPAAPIGHLESGIVVHRALELLVREAMVTGHRGPFSATRAQELLSDAWAMEKAVGVDTYAATSAMLDRFVATEGDFDARWVLGVEQSFALPLGEFMLHGVMDRVDCVDGGTIEITDYKTGEVIPSGDQVQNNLQLSLYQYAAQRLWPWAREVRLTLHMVRHGIKLRTTRTPEAIAHAVAYATAMGRRIKAAEGTKLYPARLSPSCGTCPYRLSCPAYAKLTASVPEKGSAIPRSIEEAAVERERCNGIARAAEARRHEMDAILRERINARGELTAAGRRYFIRNVPRRSYPVPETVGMVTEASGMAAGDVVERLACISNGELTVLLRELEQTLPKARVNLLRAELEATADRSYTAQLWSKPAPEQAATEATP